MSKQLSERETAVLQIILARNDTGVTGSGLARALDAHPHPAHLHTSPLGAHRTAASLVRKQLAWRVEGFHLAYKITQLGRDALDGKAGEWRARTGGAS